MGCFISTEKRIQRITKSSSFKFLVVRTTTRRNTATLGVEASALAALAATRRDHTAAGALC
jgi:hypothetical protein